MIQAALPSLHVTQIFRVQFDRHPRNRRHWHNFYEACLVLNGQGSYDHGDETFLLEKGDLFIADPSVVHEIMSLQTRDLELFFTSFAIDSDGLSNGGNSIISAYLHGHWIHAKDKSYLETQFEALLGLYAEANASYRLHFHDNLMQQLVLQIMAELTQKKASIALQQSMPPEIRRATEAIEARLSQNIHVSDLAEIVNISERTLRRRFQAHFGHSVAEEIRIRRMRRAARLLAQAEWTVAEVGYQVGIEDPGQFTRTFKATMGISPKAFRDNTDQARATLDDRFMQTAFL